MRFAGGTSSLVTDRPPARFGLIGSVCIARIEDERLVVTPLSSEEPDIDLDELRANIAGLLPEIDLVDLLVEVNSWCGFLDELIHAGNATDRSADHAGRLFAAGGGQWL